MIRLDDMRVMAALADSDNFTHAARRLQMPKQTVSRRIAELEQSLGVRLVERTTRTLRLTEAGRAYAQKCADVVRLAEEANEAAIGVNAAVSGTLRVTADPLFGELFLSPIVSDFLRQHPAVRVEVMLTQRYVDLIEEGVDVAFRVGQLGDSSLVATRIAPAVLTYCAAPGYLRERGTPRAPEELERHDCVVLAPEGGPARWAFRRGDAIDWVRIDGRLRVNSLALARRAALEGLGIANLPAFACAQDLAEGRLVEVLGDRVSPFGGIHVVYPSRRFQPPRVRLFVEAAIAHLRQRPELITPAAPPQAASRPQRRS